MISYRCNNCRRISFTSTEQPMPCPYCKSVKAERLHLTAVKPRRYKHLTLIRGGAA